MKLILIVLFSLCIIGGHAQSLQLKGRVRCSNDVENLSTRGAENIIIVPTAIPSLSVPTSTDPPGYYLIDTKVSKEDLYDQVITLSILTNCKTCQTKSIRKFISLDQIENNQETPQINLKTTYIKDLCDSLEFSAIAIDTILSDLYSYENKYGDGDVWVASPGLLNLLMLFSPLASPNPDSIIENIIPIDEISLPEIKYGAFLLNSSFVNSSTAGFNFSPSRDFSEAAFWNPASILFYHKKANISVSTNWRSQFKASSFFKFKDKFAISVGVINSFQREKRFVYSSFMDEGDELEQMFRLNEFATYLSASFRILKKLGVGITGKYIKQKLDNPQSLLRTIEYKDGIVKNTDYELIHKEYNNSKFDIDLSFSYSLNRSINIGLNFMNITNSKLIGSSFLENESLTLINQFSIGSGISYKYRRFNIGVDLLFYENSIYNATFGLNYVPFNKALIQVSFSTKEMVHSLSFKYHRFKISYINSRGLLILKSKNQPKTIERPYLYSSFTINF